MIREIVNKRAWGWCLHCECAISPEVFAEIAARPDDDPNVPAHTCPFEGCDGGGIGFDLFEIEDIPTGESTGFYPGTWPASPEKPVHGKEYPLYKPKN